MLYPPLSIKAQSAPLQSPNDSAPNPAPSLKFGAISAFFACNLLFLIGVVWVGLLVAGFGIMTRESFTPVAPTFPLQVFPPRSSIDLSSRYPTLVLFVHPLCPCTRATLYELQELLLEAPDKISVVIVFCIPAGLPAAWKSEYLWKSATGMSGVKVVEDQNGVEAARFRVSGSGHCLLFSPSGNVLFSGGITPSRGHEGENSGRLAVLGWITGGYAKLKSSPVFGCSLQ